MSIFLASALALNAITPMEYAPVMEQPFPAESMVSIHPEEYADNNMTCTGSIISPSWAVFTSMCAGVFADGEVTVESQGRVPFTWDGEIIRDENKEHSLALVNFDGVYSGSLTPLQVSTQELSDWIADETGYHINDEGIQDNGPRDQSVLTSWKNRMISFATSFWN